MKHILMGSLLAALTIGCSEIADPVSPEFSREAATESSAVASKKGSNPVERPFKMNRSNLSLDWGIEGAQEVACQIALGAATSPEDAEEIAGGEISGSANLTHLGLAEVHLSAAWDVGNLLAEPEFDPVSPAAGGPAAPVLGPDDYPYTFHVNPFEPPLPPSCETVVTATGELLLTAANGDELHGSVLGGETHRLDFIQEGDGVETFAIIEADGGTGRFADATGSFVVHTITRFDFDAQQFVIDLAEFLPGGTIVY